MLLLKLQIVQSLFRGTTWETSGIFPRVTYCDIPIQSVGQPYTRTIQCVLPVNMINEKIYIFLWIWAVVCLIYGMTTLSYLFLFKVCRYKIRSLHRYKTELEKVSAQIEQKLNSTRCIVPLRLQKSTTANLHLYKQEHRKIFSKISWAETAFSS